MKEERRKGFGEGWSNSSLKPTTCSPWDLKRSLCLSFFICQIGAKLLEPAYFSGLYKDPMRYHLKGMKHSTDVRDGWSSGSDVEKDRNYWVTTHSLGEILGRESHGEESHLWTKHSELSAVLHVCLLGHFSCGPLCMLGVCACCLILSSPLRYCKNLDLSTGTSWGRTEC